MTDAAKASTTGYAWNPVSGRFVKKSGPTYLRLVKCGVLEADPSLYIVQRAAPDPAQAPAPAQGRRREALAPPEAEQYSDDDDDNDLAARVAELLTARKSKARAVKPIARLPRARIVVAPPTREGARGSGRRQIAELFDASTDASESEY